MIGSGESVFVTLTSAEGLTVVVALAWLLVLLGSAVVEEIEALLVVDAAAVVPTLATIVTVASLAAPALRVPIAQVTVDVPEHVPLVELAETTVRPVGNVSETDTPAAGLGPLLWAVIVYLTLPPTDTGSGESVFV